MREHVPSPREQRRLELRVAVWWNAWRLARDLAQYRLKKLTRRVRALGGEAALPPELKHKIGCVTRRYERARRKADRAGLRMWAATVKLPL